MRGLITFAVFSAIVWVFWMSWQWLRNKNK